MGEAKRRRMAGQMPRQNFAPDFGIAMWHAGHKDALLTAYMRVDTVDEYEDCRELTGHIHQDDRTFSATVRTLQQKDKILAAKDSAGMAWVIGKLATNISTGDNGERFRALLGYIESEQSRQASTDLPGLMAKLMVILHRGTALTDDHQQVAEIGKELDAYGGLDLMQAVYDAISKHRPYDEGGCHPSVLQWAWDGIGAWHRPARHPAEDSDETIAAAGEMSVEDVQELRRRLQAMVSTKEGMERFLADMFGAEGFQYDPVEDVWVVPDSKHRGPGRGFYIVRPDGTWFGAVVPEHKMS
jgi:hypothetical protein